MEQWQIGDLKVVKVIETQDLWLGTRLMEEMNPDGVLREASWLVPHFADDAGKIRISFHSLVVEAGGMRILVDTCIGNDKPRQNPVYNLLHTNYLRDLEAAGYPRESIDRVICTHMHIDHVGWNTILSDGRWVPTFPNARYLLNRREFDHWNSVAAARPQMEDSVQPVIDAGLVDWVEYGAVLTPEVTVLGTPGHTPGHMSIALSSRGHQAVISGDLLHHPIQCAHPEWKCKFDTDTEQACATRWDFLRRCAEGRLELFGSHFLTPSYGRVVRHGDAFRFQI